MSLMNNRKSLIYSGIAGVAVFVIFFLIAFGPSSNNNNNQTVTGYDFVITKKTIKKDAVIAEDDVTTKHFAIKIDNAVTATADVVGKKANKDIEADKPVLKAFLKETKTGSKDEVKVKEPKKGYRAVPVLIKKSAIPPFVSTSGKYDLLTKENNMKIENLTILNMLDPEDKSTKLLLLEIKDSDVPSFVKHQVKTKGFVFIHKNKSEYGDYRFIADDRITPGSSGKTYAPSGSLPPIDKIPQIDDIGQIGDLNQNYGTTGGKEVELVIGSKKSKVRF